MSGIRIERIRMQGDRCLLIDLGHQIDEKVGLQCLALAERIRLAAIPGVLDIVPSFIAVAVYFEPTTASGDEPAKRLIRQIEQLANGLQADTALQARRVRVPICYGGQHGPDLEDVAKRMSLTPQAVIAAHHGSISRVYMLGFAPGHPYIGIHDERFALPRREVPRTAVPAGSLGIANRQSTIYPNVLPGGWHIIGATPLKLFRAQASEPTLLMPGDEIEFVPINEKEFDRLQAQQAKLPGAGV